MRLRAQQRTRRRVFLQHRQQKRCVLMLLAGILMVVLAGALVGCDGAAPVDNAGGLDPESETPQKPNEVNPSQLPDSSFIYDAAIADLEKADSYMNGQTVQVIGEVVGDRIISEESPTHCWIMLQATDGSYAEMSVYLPITSTNLIDTYGAYGRRGTILQVRGIFNLSCKDHDGLTDIHANHVTVVTAGTDERIPFNPERLIPGAILLVIGGFLVLLYGQLRERQR